MCLNAMVAIEGVFCDIQSADVNTITNHEVTE
jgi:hypothetical protein